MFHGVYSGLLCRAEHSDFPSRAGTLISFYPRPGPLMLDCVHLGGKDHGLMPIREPYGCILVGMGRRSIRQYQT